MATQRHALVAVAATLFAALASPASAVPLRTAALPLAVRVFGTAVRDGELRGRVEDQVAVTNEIFGAADSGLRVVLASLERVGDEDMPAGWACEEPSTYAEALAEDVARTVNVFVCPRDDGARGEAGRPVDDSGVPFGEDDASAHYVQLNLALMGGETPDDTMLARQLGRYLGLLPTYHRAGECREGGGDLVGDTPEQLDPDYECYDGRESEAPFSCSSGERIAWDNLMSESACPRSITPGQRDRVFKVLREAMPRLLVQDSCRTEPCGDHSDCVEGHVGFLAGFDAEAEAALLARARPDSRGDVPFSGACADASKTSSAGCFAQVSAACPSGAGLALGAGAAEGTADVACLPTSSVARGVPFPSGNWTSAEAVALARAATDCGAASAGTARVPLPVAYNDAAGTADVACVVVDAPRYSGVSAVPVETLAVLRDGCTAEALGSAAAGPQCAAALSELAGESHVCVCKDGYGDADLESDGGDEFGGECADAPAWVAGEWSGSCGDDCLERRSVTCFSAAGTGERVPDTDCEAYERPAAARDCDSGVACEGDGAAAPANDECAAATVASGVADAVVSVFDGSITRYTGSAEVALPPPCEGASHAGGADAWYKADVGGVAGTLQATLEGAEYATTLSAFPSCSGTASQCAGAGTGVGNSANLTVRTAAGTDAVYFRVAADLVSPAAAGVFTLTFRFQPDAPPSDVACEYFGGIGVLSGASGTVDGVLLPRLVAVDRVSTMCGNSGRGGLINQEWYRLAAVPAGAVVTMAAVPRDGAVVDMVLSLHSVADDTCPPASRRCNDDSSGRNPGLSFVADEDDTEWLLVRVGVYSDASTPAGGAPFTLSWIVDTAATWEMGEWGECSADTCTETRAVQCVDDEGGAEAASACPGDAPDAERACTGEGGDVPDECAPPAYDQCALAAEYDMSDDGLSGSARGSLVLATPSTPGVPTCASDDADDDDAWFFFRAAADGFVDVRAAGLSFDAAVSVYVGAGCPQPSDVPLCAGPSPAVVLGDAAVSEGQLVRVRVQAASPPSELAGEFYTSFVLTPSASTGGGADSGTDACGNTVVDLPFPRSAADVSEVGVSLVESGTAYERTGSCGSSGSFGAWVRFVAGGTGTVYLTVVEANFDTVMTIHRGRGDVDSADEACVAGPAMACDDDGGVGVNSAFSFGVVGGRTYFLRVRQYSTSTLVNGSFRLSIARGDGNWAPAECADAVAADGSGFALLDSVAVDSGTRLSALCESGAPEWVDAPASWLSVSVPPEVVGSVEQGFFHAAARSVTGSPSHVAVFRGGADECEEVDASAGQSGVCSDGVTGAGMASVGVAVEGSDQVVVRVATRDGDSTQLYYGFTSGPAASTGYEWQTGSFSACSSACVRVRTVRCVSSASGVAASDDSLCDAAARPAAERPCAGDSCTHAWSTSAWSSCLSSCRQTATVRCLDSGGALSADAWCPAGLRLPTSRLCVGNQCSPNAAPESEDEFEGGYTVRLTVAGAAPQNAGEAAELEGALLREVCALLNAQMGADTFNGCYPGSSAVLEVTAEVGALGAASAFWHASVLFRRPGATYSSSAARMATELAFAAEGMGEAYLLEQELFLLSKASGALVEGVPNAYDGCGETCGDGGNIPDGGSDGGGGGGGSGAGAAVGVTFAVLGVAGVAAVHRSRKKRRERAAAAAAAAAGRNAGEGGGADLAPRAPAPAAAAAPAAAPPPVLEMEGAPPLAMPPAVAPPAYGEPGEAYAVPVYPPPAYPAAPQYGAYVPEGAPPPPPGSTI